MKNQKQKNTLNNIPDPRLHQIISFIKSGVRILGYVALPFSIIISAVLLAIAEIIGVVEELV